MLESGRERGKEREGVGGEGGRGRRRKSNGTEVIYIEEEKTKKA